MSILNHTPHFNLPIAEQLARDLYGLHAAATLLPSERDQNFLLETKTGELFVLKIANAAEEYTLLEAQDRVLERLSETGLFPRLHLSIVGKEIETVLAPRGEEHFVRLVTFLPGTPMGKIRRHSPRLLTEVGRSVGIFHTAMAGFDHPAFHRYFHWDLVNGPEIVRRNLVLIGDPEQAVIIGRLMDAFEHITAPLLPGLRKSVIYNDANDYNILVGGGEDLFDRNQHVVGLIDLGDMVHSFTVGDLAVAIAYAILDKPDPLASAAQVISGYHAVHPLQEDEITALFGLVALRLCMSACIAAEQQQHRPDDAYLGISQEPIRRTLPMFAEIPPRLFEATLRKACGLDPVPAGTVLIRWLQEHSGDFASILNADLRTTPLIVFDLSVGSPLLDGDPDRNVEPHLTSRLGEIMDAAGVHIGIGRYNEARYLYTTPPFVTSEGSTDGTHTIHLGIDLFVPVGTPVFAPLDGIVQAFTDNTVAQDCGPVIVLEHIANGNHFHTLYRHLSRESLLGLQVGQEVKKGERFGVIGASEVNSGWTPHLHFQVLVDHLNLATNFPGVASPSQRDLWTAFCPDPNLFLGIPAAVFPPPEPDKAATLAARRERLAHNLSISYQEPIKVVRGWKQYLFDEQGFRYLDTYNNVAHVGHCHPHVVDTIRRQIGVLNTNTRYLHDFINRYAERLCAKLPEPLQVCFFLNSASEANELALRLAREYTGQRDMIVLEAAYHGHTSGLIDISPYKHAGPGGVGAPDWVHVAPIADPYRGPYKHGDPGAGEKYAAHVAAIIKTLQVKGRGPAGFIAESLPSVGGQIVFPLGYLSEVYRVVRAAGGLCIADEVQTGLGRVGSHFWGFEMQGVIPDIVVLGKPIGNGHPLGALVTTRPIADAFDNGMEFFSTFGGNPVSCAAGMAVLEVIEAEDLQAHALRVGERMLAGLRPLVERYPLVGEVRGSGLFLGAELVRDRSTLEPAEAEAAFVVNRLREHGILLGTDGPYHNVIKIRPPMPFNEGNADFLVATFEKILMEDFTST